jgi:diguanylate cyclase (GGDEF)-like protein
MGWEDQTAEAASGRRVPRGRGLPGADGIRQAVSDLRFEIMVIGLLLLTIGAVLFSNFILRNTVVISTSETARLTAQWHGDQSLGGSSTVRADAHRPLQWSCTLRAQYRYPFCAYEILLEHGRGHGLDLSRFQTIAINLAYSGPADSFRVYLKNFDPAYSQPQVRDTLKFNQIELPVSNGKQVVEARLADFKVADWWIQKNRIAYRLSHTQFDNVVGIEIDTGISARPGEHHFRIESIVLKGNIVPIEQWYLGIISFWIVLTCLFLISRILGLQRDLRQRRRLHAAAQSEAKLAQESARRDPLTGLYNRLGVTECYPQMLSEWAGKPAAIMLIDIDHFKAINDGFGHEQGDQVLAAFAALLRDNTRDSDLIARWGGEEFLLIGRVSDPHAAVEIAEKLRGLISAHSFVHGKLTASFGVHYCDRLPENPGPAIACADRALYSAKEQGRNLVVRYVPEEHETGRQNRG